MRVEGHSLSSADLARKAAAFLVRDSCAAYVFTRRGRAPARRQQMAKLAFSWIGERRALRLQEYRAKGSLNYVCDCRNVQEYPFAPTKAKDGCLASVLQAR